MGRFKLLPRHKKLLALFVMLTSFAWSIGLYIFVAVHFRHVWSIFLVCFSLFCMFFSPAICFGYNSEDPALLVPSSGSMDLNTFLMWRDLGYVMAAIFYLLTYLFPIVPWYSSGGLTLPVEGVILTYIGNLAFYFFYVVLLRLLIFVPKSNE